MQRLTVILCFVLAQTQESIGRCRLTRGGDETLEGGLCFRKAVLIVEQGPKAPPSFAPGGPKLQSFLIEIDGTLPLVGATRSIRFARHLRKSSASLGCCWICREKKRQEGYNGDHREEYTWGGLQEATPHESC
jgi:hypothetical protein